MEGYNENNLSRPTSIVSTASSRPTSTLSTNSNSTSYSYSSNVSALYPQAQLSKVTTPTSPSFRFPTLANLNIDPPSPLIPISQLPTPATNINPRHALMRSRRVSLPANLVHTNYQSLAGVVASSSSSSGNRMSVASFSSFGSLPEEEEESNVIRIPAPPPPSLKRMSSSPPESPTLMRQNLPSPPPISSPMTRSTSTPYSRTTNIYQSSLSANSRSASPSGRSSPLSFDRSFSESREQASERKQTRRLEKEQKKNTTNWKETDIEKLRREERRWRIALELRDTERSYVQVLEEIDSLYYQPLLSSSITIVPLSDLALRRARKAFSAPTSPNLSPTVLPTRLSVYSPLESIPSLTTASSSAQNSPTGPILSRPEIAEIFSNFKDVLGLSRVMLETLEKEVQDRPSQSIPLSIVTQVASREGTRTPDLSSSAETEFESDGPKTPNDSLTGAPTQFNMTPTIQSKKDKIKTAPSPQKLGKILLPILPFLKSYSLFVSNFSSALSQISAIESSIGIGGEEKRLKWKRFCEERESGIGKGKGLGLGGLLLNIVQRVPRYRFLLGDIIKYTGKEHPDLKDLKKAYDIVDGVASHLDSQIRNHANVLQVLELQRSFVNLDVPLLAPGRHIIKSGLLRKLDRRGNDQVRNFFLFNDILIHASGGESINLNWGVNSSESLASEPMSRSNSSKSYATSSKVGSSNFIPSIGINQYKFHARFELENVTVVGIEDSVGSGRKFGFEILTPEKSFAVYAESLNHKIDWIEAIRSTKADLMRDRRTLQLDRRSPNSLSKRDRRISLPVSSLNPIQAQGFPIQQTSTPNHLNSLPPRLGFTPPSPSNDPLLISSRPLSANSTYHTPEIEIVSDSNTEIRTVESTEDTPIEYSSELVEFPVAENYCAPVWVPDSKAERCMRCSGGFSVWRRRHHCRLCGIVVCWACSMNNFIIPSLHGQDRLARSCDSCHETVFGEGASLITRMLNISTADQSSTGTTPLTTPSITATPDESGKKFGAVGRLNSLLGR